MKASKVIETIEKLMENNGDFDLRVHVDSEGTSHDIESIAGPWMSEYEKKVGHKGMFYISI